MFVVCFLKVEITLENLQSTLETVMLILFSIACILFLTNQFSPVFSQLGIDPKKSTSTVSDPGNELVSRLSYMFSNEVGTSCLHVITIFVLWFLNKATCSF